MSDRRPVIYSSAWRRAAAVPSGPAASGKWSALALAACFLVSAMLIPHAAHLPRWIETEMVLGTWWLIWVGVIAWLLCRGCRVGDDMARPALNWNLDWPEGSAGSGDSCAGAVIDAACSDAFVIVLAVILTVVGIWFIVEVLVPALAFLLYFVLRSMLALAVNDQRDCGGRPLRALFWSLVWATLYTAPIALVVWTAHSFHPIPH